jgi:hypothetical protein
MFVFIIILLELSNEKENIAYCVYYPLPTSHDPLLTYTNWATNL